MDIAKAKAPIRLGSIEVVFLVDREDTNGEVTVFEARVSPGAGGPPPHSHGHDETVCVLAGTLSVTVSGDTKELGAGESTFIPRGTVHGFANLGNDDARFLAVSTPGDFTSSYFLEMASVMSAAAGGPPDPEAVLGVMQRHGLTLAQ